MPSSLSAFLPVRLSKPKPKPKLAPLPDNRILFPNDNSTTTLTARAYLRDIADICFSSRRDVSKENVITKLEYYCSSSPVREEILSAHIVLFDGDMIYPSIEAVANFHSPVSPNTHFPAKSSSAHSLSRTSPTPSVRSRLLSLLSLAWLPLRKLSLPSLIASYKGSPYATECLRVYPMNAASWRHGMEHVATMVFPQPEHSRLSLEHAAFLVEFATRESSELSSDSILPIAWTWNVIARIYDTDVVDAPKAGGCFSCCGKRSFRKRRRMRPPCLFDDEKVTERQISDAHEGWRKQMLEFELRSNVQKKIDDTPQLERLRSLMERMGSSNETRK